MKKGILKRLNEENESSAELRIELLVVLIFFYSLGFPGNYCKIFGNILDTVLGYSLFVLEILMMLFLSGKTFLDIKLLDLKTKYIPIYQFILIVFIESMLVTSSKSDELITCIRFSVTILFSIWLIERISLERLVELFCYAQVLIDLSVIVLMLLRPGLAFQSGDTFSRALRGIYPAKNTFASELAFGAVVFFLNILKKRSSDRKIGKAEWVRWYFIIAVHLVLLVMTQATGAWLTCVIVIAFQIFIGDRQKFRLDVGWWNIGISIGFLFFAFTILPIFEPILTALGKDVTLTGRTTLWNGIYSFIQQRNMLTGFGYGHFWYDSRAVARLHTFFEKNTYFADMTTGAHNQIFELWLNIGLIGLASYFAMIAMSMARVKHLDDGQYRIFSCLLLYLTICGLTERMFIGTYTYQTVVFFILMSAGCKNTVSTGTRQGRLAGNPGTDRTAKTKAHNSI